MKREIAAVRISDRALAPGLHALASVGFAYRDGAWVLGAFANMQTNVSMNDFPDRTGYECFINSVHIEDYAEDDLLEQSIRFVTFVLRSWPPARDQRLNSVLNFDGDSAVAKFHVLRPGESWINDRLDEFEEALLVADSSEKDIVRSIFRAAGS